MSTATFSVSDSPDKDNNNPQATTVLCSVSKKPASCMINFIIEISCTDYEAAIQKYLPMANQGDPSAQFILGRI
jgi:TPR repeat protein